MASPVTSKYSVSGELRLTQVERELDRFFEENAPDEVEAGGTASIGKQRVSTLNLIVCGTQGKTDNASEYLAPTITQHPARNIIVKSEAGDDGTLTASISAACQLSAAGGSAQICSEEILIHDRGATKAELQSGISLLTIPNLPVYLWWIGAPEDESDCLSTLVDLADRVIFDTALSETAESGHLALARYAANPLFGGVEDLAWDRTMVWRSALAQLFDPPELRPLLYDLCHLEISYGPSAESQAVLFAGWLASRLNWTVTSTEADPESGKIKAILRSDTGNDVNLYLKGRAGQLSYPEHLISLRLSCSRDAPGWKFTLSRSSSGECAVAKVETAGEEPSHRVIPLDLPELPDLLSNGLGYRTVDPQYTAALSKGLEILGAPDAH